MKDLHFILLTAVLVFLAIMLMSCDPYEGPVSRIASSIRVYHQGDFRPDKVEGERPGSTTIGYYAQYYADTGEPINVGGNTMIFNVRDAGFWNDGGWYIPMNNYSDINLSVSNLKPACQKDGVAQFSIACSFKDYYAVYGGTRLKFGMSGSECGSEPAYAFFKSQWDNRTADPKDHVPAMEYTYPNPGSAEGLYVGNFWRSGSGGCLGNYGSPGIEAGNLQNPEALCSAEMTPEAFRFASSETDYLYSDPTPLKRGMICDSVSWYMDNGSTVSPVFFVYPINQCEPNIIAENATPYFVSFCVETAEAIDLEGFTVPAKIKSQSEPNGIDIPVVVVASSQNGLKHIARSEYFVCVQSQYVKSDPNGFTALGKKAHIVPISKDENLSIQVTMDTAVFFQLADCWLSDNRTADISMDGVVNYIDYTLLFDTDDPNSIINDPNLMIGL